MASRKPSAKKKTSAKRPRASDKGAQGRRKDLGAPVESFFSRHAPAQRAQLEALHALVMRAAPAARASIKWGMPFYELEGGFAALYSSPSYVGLNLMAPPEKFVDPEGRLEGTGKTMRHLKVRSDADLDEASITRWLKTAIAHHSGSRRSPE